MHAQPQTSHRTLATLLQEERVRRGWSQQDLADRLETTTQTISRWERGVVMPGPYYRQKLAYLFGVSPVELRLLPDDSAGNAPQEGCQPSGSETSVHAPPVAVSSLSGGAKTKWAPNHPLIMHICVGVVLLVAIASTFVVSKSLFSAPTRAAIGTLALGSSERFQSNSAQGMNDEVSIHVALPSAPSGMSYYAWMADNGVQSESQWRFLGELTQKNGDASLFYASPQHENLLVRFNQFLVTQEATDVPPLQPSSVVCETSISTAATPGDPRHYSLLDHLRHLLASDPTLTKAGIQGGLDYWLVRNTQQVQGSASGLIADFHAQRLSDLRVRLIRILDYLDGSSHVGADVPSGTPLLVQLPGTSVGLLTLSPAEDQEGYVLHTDIHLEGVLHAPGASPYQQQLAGQIRIAMNRVGLALSNMRQDAIQLLRMDNTQIAQSAALQVLTDLEIQAQEASNDHQEAATSPSSGSLVGDLHWIDRSIQQLATLTWQRA